MDGTEDDLGEQLEQDGRVGGGALDLELLREACDAAPDPSVGGLGGAHLLAVPPHVAAERLAQLEAEPADVAIVGLVLLLPPLVAAALCCLSALAPTPSSSPWRPRRWLVRCPPSAWKEVKARLQVLQTKSPSPEVATTGPLRLRARLAAAAGGAVLDESEVVDESVVVVLSDSASDTSS